MQSVFRTEKVNFKNIIHYPDLRVEPGRQTFICGDSGSGKSTLLKLFNGVESPEEGRLFYRGEDIAQMDTIELRRQVSLAGQSVYLFGKTIRENFKLFYNYRDLKVPSVEDMTHSLELCCAAFSPAANCRELSGGERQRVYLALFLSFVPSVLMLDEPTSALDRRTGFKVMENIADFCKENKTTLVVVSHDMELIDKFAEEKIVLKTRWKNATGC